jgi:hypothetical protein
MALVPPFHPNPPFGAGIILYNVSNRTILMGEESVYGALQCSYSRNIYNPPAAPGALPTGFITDVANLNINPARITIANIISEFYSNFNHNANQNELRLLYTTVDYILTNVGPRIAGAAAAANEVLITPPNLSLFITLTLDQNVINALTNIRNYLNQHYAAHLAAPLGAPSTYFNTPYTQPPVAAAAAVVNDAFINLMRGPILAIVPPLVPANTLADIFLAIPINIKYLLKFINNDPVKFITKYILRDSFVNAGVDVNHFVSYVSKRYPPPHNNMINTFGIEEYRSFRVRRRIGNILTFPKGENTELEGDDNINHWGYECALREFEEESTYNIRLNITNMIPILPYAGRNNETLIETLDRNRLPAGLVDVNPGGLLNNFKYEAFLAPPAAPPGPFPPAPPPAPPGAGGQGPGGAGRGVPVRNSGFAPNINFNTLYKLYDWVGNYEMYLICICDPVPPIYHIPAPLPPIGAPVPIAVPLPLGVPPLPVPDGLNIVNNFNGNDPITLNPNRFTSELFNLRWVNTFRFNCNANADNSIRQLFYRYQPPVAAPLVMPGRGFGRRSGIDNRDRFGNSSGSRSGFNNWDRFGNSSGRGSGSSSWRSGEPVGGNANTNYEQKLEKYKNKLLDL